MPEITVTIESGHVAWLENQAEKVGITVDAWVNNLIGLSQKTLPQIAILSTAAQAEMRQRRERVA